VECIFLQSSVFKLRQLNLSELSSKLQMINKQALMLFKKKNLKIKLKKKNTANQPGKT